MKPKKSRFMQELTARDVADYLKRSDIVIVPIGSNEGHGALMPLGTDVYVAEAVAKRAAEAMDALVAPTVVYTYAGGTKVFPGTVSMPAGLAGEHLEAIVRELIRNCFKRIYLVQWHSPYYVHEQLARDIFEKTGVPVVYFGLLKMPAIQKLIRRFSGGASFEAAALAAALDILGKDLPLDTSLMPGDQEITPRAEDACLGVIGKAGGVVGHYFTHESQHQAFRKKIDKKAGMALINAMAANIAATADSLKEYIRILGERQAEGRNNV